MTDEERRAIEWECRTLAIRFAHFADSRDHAALAALFTLDGVFARPTAPDQPIRGRDAIRAAFESRPKDKITRHFYTNILIDVLTPSRAEGALYVLLYTAGAGSQGVAKADPVQLVGEFRDTYVLEAGGWRIKERIGSLVMRAG